MRNRFFPSRWLRLAFVAVMTLTPLLFQHPTTAQTTTIRFAFWGDPVEQAAYEALIAGFETSHPTIDVQSDYTPGQGDYQNKLATDFAAGNGPDLFLINYRRFAQFAAPGALEPVAPYLAASTVVSAGDFYSISMDAFKYRDIQTCMPQNVSSLVVYYNADLFAAAGIPLPATGWTWDDFIAAAEQLTVDTDGDGAVDQYGVVVDPSMYRFVSFIWSAGGEVVDDTAHPSKLTIDSPEALAGIEQFASLGVSGHNVVPPDAEVQAEDDEARFMRGGAGMYLQSRRVVPALREIKSFTWDVAPLPTIAQPATVLHSDAYCMSSASANPNAVWSFVEYAVSDQGQTLLAETGRIVPARTSVSTSDAFLLGTSASGGDVAAPRPPRNSQVYLDNIPNIHVLPSISTWPEIEDAFDAEFSRAFYEPMDLTSAVQRVIASTEDAFARAAADSAATPAS